MGTSTTTIGRTVAFAALVAAATLTPAAAQDFYKGKTLTIIVGFSPGGGFDINARVLSRHIGRHIPGNPTVVVQNMPGAGSITSVLYLDVNAPKDGTALNIFNFGAIGDSKLNPAKIKVDFRKVNWIGSISEDLTVCYVWSKLGVKNLAELTAHPTIHMGLTGPGTSTDLNQRILRDILGVKLQQVPGYPGSAEVRLAIERGELDGDCGAWSSIPEEWIAGKKIVPVVRSAPATAPDLPDGVPYSADVAKTERDKEVIKLLTASGQVGRPFVASMSVPAERIRILRDAFNATMKDPAFIAELQKLRLPLSPKTGEEALKTVEEIYAAPDDVVAAAKKVAGE